MNYCMSLIMITNVPLNERKKIVKARKKGILKALNGITKSKSGAIQVCFMERLKSTPRAALYIFVEKLQGGSGSGESLNRKKNSP